MYGWYQWNFWGYGGGDGGDGKLGCLGEDIYWVGRSGAVSKCVRDSEPLGYFYDIN